MGQQFQKQVGSTIQKTCWGNNSKQIVGQQFIRLFGATIHKTHWGNNSKTYTALIVLILIWGRRLVAVAIKFTSGDGTVKDNVCSIGRFSDRAIRIVSWTFVFS